jgi:hypothetical protein
MWIYFGEEIGRLRRLLMEGEFKMLNKDIMKMINNSYPNNEVKKQ